MAPTKVVLLSIEPWDHIWRRNQHIAARLITQGWASSLTFITPPAGGLALQAKRWSPLPGVTVVTPPLVVPRRYGGHRVLAPWLRHEAADADVIWVNDPVAGAGLLPTSTPVIYDVTDDWRSMRQQPGDLIRVVRSEDALTAHAHIVVCSSVLAERWRERYGLDPAIVPNGVDIEAIHSAPPADLAGPGPHAVYVGTLHENRIDTELILELARSWPGSIHLVGPYQLNAVVTGELRQLGVDIVGAVPSADVPRWLNAADMLICPHLVDDFTLSLDAIKSHEYLATDKPIIATASSGFQVVSAEGLYVVEDRDFVRSALSAVGESSCQRSTAVDWSVRAEAFARELGLMT